MRLTCWKGSPRKCARNFPHFSSALSGACRLRQVQPPPISSPSTPLKRRLAQERGEVAQAEPSIVITGELLRPAGSGPFPGACNVARVWWAVRQNRTQSERDDTWLGVTPHCVLIPSPLAA